MNKKTVLIALSIFLLAALGGGYLWSKRPEIPPVPRQVEIFNMALDNKMATSGNNNWYSKEDGVGYFICNTTGEGTGYVCMVIDIECKNATDLSKVDKIVAGFFPDDTEEIMSEISRRQEKLNNHWLVGEAYKHTYQNNEITVKAIDGHIPTIETEIIQQIEGVGCS